MKVRFLSPAREEMAESMLYYLEENPHAALRFEQEVEAAVADIVEAPTRYRRNFRGVRVKTLEHFPFSIYDHVAENEIRIVSVAHHARMPGYWHGRIE